MADPVMVQLAQGIARPSFNEMLGIKFFCGGVQFIENFTMCDLDKFDVIIGNTFLDVYEVDIFCSKGKLKIHPKYGFKLMNLDLYYNSTLAKMGVNLVTLASELELFNFLVLIFLRIS